MVLPREGPAVKVEPVLLAHHSCQLHGSCGESAPAWSHFPPPVRAVPGTEPRDSTPAVLALHF